MEYLFSFVVAVMAHIVGYFMCRWLDKQSKSDK